MDESLVGRQNPYVCKECGGVTNTIHVNDGVTPFMLDCRATDGCKGMATSSFYPRGPRPARIPAPTWEWYTPGADQPLKNGERYHVEQGGVLLRALTPSTRERFPEAFAAPIPVQGTAKESDHVAK